MLSQLLPTPNMSMQRTALRAAADVERYIVTHREPIAVRPEMRFRRRREERSDVAIRKPPPDNTKA